MAYVAVQNTVMAEFRFTSGGVLLENTLYFERNVAVDIPSMTALGVTLENWWDVNIKPLQIPAISYREVFLTDLTDQNAPTASQNALSGATGTHLTGSSMPFNVTCSISFRTNQRGRSFRGRNYVIGLATDQVSGNSLVAVQANLYEAAYADIFPTIPADWTWVVVSRFKDKAPRPVGVTTPIVSAVFTDTTLDSQRRRLPGRGE